jgi:uncharacterized membrane protein
MNYWPLLGIGVVVAGFALKRNAVLVVVAAGVTSALAAGMAIGDLLALLGNAFVSNRALLLFVLTLPVIGLLERHGLRERAQAWIANFKTLSLARLLLVYLGARQVLSMFGLIDLAGHAQTVRPLLAPMAEAAAQTDARTLSAQQCDEVRALCAATDNVGRFFGEDVFLAFGAVLLIQSFYERHGIHLEPLAIALWALPTALAAFVIHAVRIVVFERRLAHGTPAGVAASARDAATEPDDHPAA